MNTLFYITMTLFILICVFLILLILIQKGRGGGLASAFGGGGGGSTAFGSKTGDVLTWATSIVFGIFLVLAVALNLLCNHLDAERTARILGQTPASEQPMEPPAESGSNLPKVPIPSDPGDKTSPSDKTAPSVATSGPSTTPSLSANPFTLSPPAVSAPATQPTAVPSTQP